MPTVALSNNSSYATSQILLLSFVSNLTHQTLLSPHLSSTSSQTKVHFQDEVKIKNQWEVKSQILILKNLPSYLWSDLNVAKWLQYR